VEEAGSSRADQLTLSITIRWRGKHAGFNPEPIFLNPSLFSSAKGCDIVHTSGIDHLFLHFVLDFWPNSSSCAFPNNEVSGDPPSASNFGTGAVGEAFGSVL
jgi:hypothetical protein